MQYCHIFIKNNLSSQKRKLYFKESRLLIGGMATIIKEICHEKQRNIGVAVPASSFCRSQAILFKSRKKHGLLYSIATVAGLFCIPGILNVMSSETEIQPLIQRILAPPFITAMIAVGMYILNDLVDAEADKANSKNRPIPSGLVSRKQAWSFIILTNGAAIGITIAALNVASIILVVPMIVIGILYSVPKIALMNRFVLKNMAIASFYMLCTMLGITSNYGIVEAINNPTAPIHTMAISGVMIFVGSIVNDLGDTKGDKQAGRRTIPIVIGGENTIRMLIILLLMMPTISWMLHAKSVGQETISLWASIAVTGVALLALLRIAKIRKVFEDMHLMREQHKKWFPLYIVLQVSFVAAALLTL
jgi:geranylgeranylglycerol-phosphate geranylgeranyltransferase